MKKISVLVLVMLLIVQMTAFASPAASTITIDVVQTGENIDVTAIVAGAQEVPERMTIQIFPTVNTEVSTGSSQVTFTVNTMVYMEETSNVATVENGYKYTFETFTLNPILPTGEYKFKVGGTGIGYNEITANYTSMTDLITALKTIDGVAVAENLTTELITNGYAKKAGLSAAQYESFSTYWKNKVNGAVVYVDFGTSVLSDDDFDGFSQAREDLEEEFNKAVELALLCGAGTNDEFASVIANDTYSSVQDTSYLDKLEDLNFVAARMKEASYDAVNLYGETKAHIYDIFDGAVLTAVIAQLDWSVVEEAMAYYENKGLFILDKTTFNKIVNKENVYKALGDAGITDYTLIPGKFAKICTDVYNGENPTYTPSPSKPITGGGGGGGVIGGSKDEPNVTEKEDADKEEAPAVAFSDIDNVIWAKTAILDLAEKGIINGVGDGKFMPTSYIKREEAVKMLVEAFDLEGNADVEFNDVSKDNWYYDAVLNAVGSGVVNGISETEFGSGNYITRQDLATMAYRALVSKYSVEVKESAKFTDFDDLSDYAEVPVSALKELGVLSGYDDGTFMPDSYMNRAEFACMLYKILNLIK